MASIRTLTRERSYQPIPLYNDQNINRSIKLDLNSLYIRHPAETFFIHVKNPHLIAWGIDLNDLLIVENNLPLLINDLLVLELNNEYKFYQFLSEIDGKKILFSLDNNEPNLQIQKWEEVKIAGIITNVIHQIRNRIPQTKYAA